MCCRNFAVATPNFTWFSNSHTHTRRCGLRHDPPVPTNGYSRLITSLPMSVMTLLTAWMAWLLLMVPFRSKALLYPRSPRTHCSAVTLPPRRVWTSLAPSPSFLSSCDTVTITLLACSINGGTGRASVAPLLMMPELNSVDLYATLARAPFCFPLLP